MFALAIWDQNKGELVLARDQFGIKPLYYSGIVNHEQGCPIRGFLFASEIRALLASELVPRRLDCDGLASYLTYGSVRAPLTMVSGIRSLMPGNLLRVRVADGLLTTTEQSYLPEPHSSASEPVLRTEDNASPEIPHSRPEAVALLRKNLENSISAHLVSDVPLGVFLSGGMDSSALVALIKSISSQTPRTFSVVFDEPQFSEAPHSRRIAGRFKTDHKEVRLTEDYLLRLLPQAIVSLDQPTMDGINTFVISQAVKKAGIKVALSGVGGDELFAGYPTFRRALRMASSFSFAKRLLNSASGIASRAPATSVQQKKFWQLVASDGTPEAVCEVTRQLFAPETVESLMSNSAAQDLKGSAAWALTRFSNRNGKPDDPVNVISRLELQGYLMNTLLRDTDCMSMANSLEVRVPFVDVPLVSYVLSLPGKWKLNGANSSSPKPLLAEAVCDLLPSDFLQRPKMGFTLPFERWMQHRLQPELSDVLENKNATTAAGLNSRETALLWRRFLETPRRVGWSRPWALYVLAKWCEINQVKADIS
jgi:asparagine synthase (glutamine-hydrolysing)